MKQILAELAHQPECNIPECEARFRAVFEQAAIGISLVAPDGRWVDVNPALCAMLGYRRDEFLKLSIDDLTHPDDRTASRARLESRQNNGSPTYRAQKRYIHKLGYPVWVELTVSKIPTPGSAEYIGFVVEIGARKEAEEVMEQQVALRTQELAETVASLRATEAQLRASLADKTVLLQEVHHRVKNNLQIVSSLLYMAAQCSPQEQTKRVLRTSQQRVLSMALVHEQLYQSDHMSNIDIRTYISALSARVLRSLCPDSTNIAIHTEIDPVALGVEQAIPCGLILNELISNSFKHAFSKGQSGTVSVCFAQVGGEICLSVADTGEGIAEGVDPLNSKSLGMKIVGILARQLGGAVRFERRPRTRFTVTFPRN